MIPRFKPMRLHQIRKPFDSPDWVFELKHDGFRALAYIDSGRCQLVSRRNLTYRSFDNLKLAMSKLRVQNAVLDGELICIDRTGRSIFNELLYRKSEPVFYAFDLLWLNGEDLRNEPLSIRKGRLERLIKSAKNESLLYAHHIENDGTKLFNIICEQNLEGIVGKRRDSIYSASAVRSWVKIKNPNYTQSERRRELFESFRRGRSDPRKPKTSVNP
jgi:bifunctional non-homologous end joining protein LigD